MRTKINKPEIQRKVLKAFEGSLASVKEDLIKDLEMYRNLNDNPVEIQGFLAYEEDILSVYTNKILRILPGIIADQKLEAEFNAMKLDVYADLVEYNESLSHPL